MAGDGRTVRTKQQLNSVVKGQHRLQNSSSLTSGSSEGKQPAWWQSISPSFDSSSITSSSVRSNWANCMFTFSSCFQKPGQTWRDAPSKQRMLEPEGSMVKRLWEWNEKMHTCAPTQLLAALVLHSLSQQTARIATCGVSSVQNALNANARNRGAMSGLPSTGSGRRTKDLAGSRTCWENP